MKDNTVKISQLVLKIGDKTVELTLEQAEELSDILDKLFNKPQTTIPYYPYYPTTTPIWAPVQTFEEAFPIWRPSITYCNAEENNGTLYLTTT